MAESPPNELPAALNIVNDDIETAPAMTIDELPPTAEGDHEDPVPSTSNGLTETQNDLYARAFGGGDDSDLSDEDDVPVRRAPTGTRRPVDDDDDDEDDRPEPTAEEDDDDDDEDEDGDYGAEEVTRLPKIKKKKREDEGDDARDEERRRKRKKRKEARRDRAVDEDEEAGPAYDEATLRRMALEERIDNVGKKPKAPRKKKRGDEDVDIVDSYHDDVCARLRENMLVAADRDRISNEQKLPATAKIAMLDEVMNVLRNTTLFQAIVDNGVLDAVRAWLEPIAHSGALPAIGIQKAFFEVLPKMDLDTTTLKECRLGPIVSFYAKTKRVTPSINRAADALVSAWSRPVLHRSANFRSRHVETISEAIASQAPSMDMDGDEEDEEVERVERVRERPKKQQRFNAKLAVQDNEGRKGARLFNNRNVQYTVAPESQLSHSGDAAHVSRIQVDNRRFNRFARAMKTKAR